MNDRVSVKSRHDRVSGPRRAGRYFLRSEMTVLGLSDDARSASADCRLKWWRFNRACKSGSMGQVVSTGAEALAAGAQAAIVLLSDGVPGEDVEDLLDSYECQDAIVCPERLT